MPYHTDKATSSAMKRRTDKSVEKQASKPKKKKPMRVFEKMPVNSHKMGDVVMSGKTHSKDSKVLGKIKSKQDSKPKKKGRGRLEKGSQAAKDYMAKIRGMRKKK
jgi:hypothetical protein|tara:strand:- start:89 stop:403 length:315 start_codon:yes stop_codon:yes gene_type:complete